MEGVFVVVALGTNGLDGGLELVVRPEPVVGAGGALQVNVRHILISIPS
jgi:hypothetical protein